ncbi:MAG: aspartate/glutamate racemase family protein, partial [Flavitalea sp.]
TQNCPLVILACNTASAKALRTIQQHDLPRLNPQNRVLGVIRPTSEVIGSITKTGKVGILATTGTVQSESYAIEINKLSPELEVFQQACPMWVPLVENNEHKSPGADYFIEKDIHQLLQKNGDIDTILLACTHYPLMIDKLRQLVPSSIQLLPQGGIVADSLQDYLERHPEMEKRCSRGGNRTFYTTDSEEDFDKRGAMFYGEEVDVHHLDL